MSLRPTLRLLAAAAVMLPAIASAQTAPASQPAPKVPTPAEAAQAAEQEDPRARPYFVKGELSSGGAVRPQTRRNFIGASGGISALPSGGDTVLNAFYLTIEPQVDLQLPKKHNLKIGLGVPLQFELFDSRGAFERCLAEARDDKQMGADQATIAMNASECVQDEQDSATENLGKLRERDWDEPSDFAKVIRYITIGGEERQFYVNVSRLYGQSVGHGTVIRRYNPNLDYNTARVGVTFDAYHRFIGFESMVNDVVNPDVVGLLGFVRPLEPLFPNVTPLRSLSFGASVAVGRNVPRTINYEPGLLEPSIDEPIPAVDSDLDMVVGSTDTVTIVGLDVETKLLRSQTSDMKLYVDVQQILDHGRGYTVGTLWRFSFGRPASMALRIRAEANYFDPDYLPSFFDGFYDIHKKQYLPAGYFSGAVAYYPTKLGYLEANAGGKRRVGGYFEATHSFLNLLTVGMAARASKGIGDAKTPGFAGPEFPDYADCSFDMDGLMDCSMAGTVTVAEPGYASLLLYGEIPFRKYLQGFVSYEVFATSLGPTTREGLDLFQFDRDNEVFFSGVRLQLLPILFISAEARRFYFLQRVTNVDINALKLEQDQNYHSEWTFALNVYAGYEF